MGLSEWSLRRQSPMGLSEWFLRRQPLTGLRERSLQLRLPEDLLGRQRTHFQFDDVFAGRVFDLFSLIVSKSNRDFLHGIVFSFF